MGAFRGRTRRTAHGPLFLIRTGLANEPFRDLAEPPDQIAFSIEDAQSLSIFLGIYPVSHYSKFLAVLHFYEYGHGYFSYDEAW